METVLMKLQNQVTVILGFVRQDFIYRSFVSSPS